MPADHTPDRVYRNAATRMILAMQPGEDDELLEWRHCTTCQNPSDPCACAGQSWPSSVARAAIDEAYRAGWTDGHAAAYLLEAPDAR